MVVKKILTKKNGVKKNADRHQPPRHFQTFQYN